ncbi:MAG TPA: M14 family zinc carboxypeptidase [Solirubrobacter sp.]|nr:M14 family zinc carboxypeptidase [Solirubrobacter sp.]
MSLTRTLLIAAVCATAGVFPPVAAADPTVDAAVAEFEALGLTPLEQFPSGRVVPPDATSATNFGYRTYEEVNAEMAALAAANPGFVALKTAPYKSVEGRDVKYLEITNDVDAADGKPVFFHMGTIHGNEWAAMEHTLEFAYDVINTSKTNPKVKALFDRVRLISMPIVNPDGVVHFRRANCAGAVPPATCPTVNSQGVDLNRNYPFGWGSNIGVSFTARGSGPGSEPEVKNTMEIVKNHQVVALVTQHTNSHALFYPGLEIAAGFPPDLDTLRGLSLAMAEATNGGYTNVRDSAHDYETSGETIDWSYYATRGFAVTFETVGRSSTCGRTSATNKSSQSPNYANCTVPDYTGTPGPTSTADQTAAYGGHPVRDGIYQALVYATLPGGHSVIKGSAAPGARLTISKDFNLYTNRILQNTTPPSSTDPQAIPTHLESSMVVPSSGQFTWDVNPSVRPNPPYRAEGMVPGPNGYLYESWTITCTAPDGTLLETRSLEIDKGETANLSLCTQGTVGGTVPATLSLTMGAPATFGAFTPGVPADYTASTTATVVSTAGDAALSVTDPSSDHPGHLVNGAFFLPSPLQAAAGTGAFSTLPASLLTYDGPVSNDVVSIHFKQPIGASDALRTGTYAKTLTFTLSTTTP